MWQECRQQFVRSVYATHNSSPQIQNALARLLASLNDKNLGLNIGAGSTNLHDRMMNLDIAPGLYINCCSEAESLPFANQSFDVLVTQETLEHVRGPYQAIQEMYRVLKPGGLLYCQLPFVIGYHPGPTDFWRFSCEGIRELVEQAGFNCEEIGIAVGPATGFYRIIVEFLAVFISLLLPSFYHPLKGLIALLLYPIKWLDPILIKSRHADRIAGGYYIIAKK